MNRATYRSSWLRLRDKYEKKMFSVFRTGLRRTALKIPFNILSESNYITLIDLTVNENEIKTSFLESYFFVGSHYGNKVGKGINRELKRFDASFFGDSFRGILLQWLESNAGYKIRSVRETLAQHLIDMIGNGIKEGTTVRDLSIQMEKYINSRAFYRWQALQIARTETTAAANFGAVTANRQSGVVTEKEWISSIDARTRRRPDDKHDHVEMDGVKVGPDALFNVQGDAMLFPGDPNGSASNVINCRCTVAVVPKRDAQGNLVYL